MSTPYDPLSHGNLASSIARALEDRDPQKLGDPIRAPGTGIYAIYYTGAFSAYALLAAKNAGACRHPIYVGKAAKLSARLGTHRLSITKAVNLDLADFSCRFLMVSKIFVPLGESLLIDTYVPLWNSYLTGIGNNAQGKGRNQQVRSSWDVLHPGREAAAKLKVPSYSVTDLVARVQVFLAGGKPQPLPKVAGESADDDLDSEADEAGEG